MRFTKMHGLGNDYVYVSTFDQPPPSDPAKLAVAVSDRHFGIGADGLILIMPSERADARMRMFNADGSEGEMCGNGVRCVAKYLYDHGLAQQAPSGDRDRPRRPEPRARGRRRQGPPGACRHGCTDPRPGARSPTLLEGRPPVDAPLRVADREFAVTAVSMGNPHAVIYVDDAAAFPLETLGPMIEHHPAFPRRVNVHVVEVFDPSELRMRTWERGSGITLACGTGACAVCVAGVLTGRSGRTIRPTCRAASSCSNGPTTTRRSS